MSRDELYAAGSAAAGPFEFNEDVARVFPDMLRRSIPGYAETLAAIAALAGRYGRPGTRCYDLGCSLGAATLAMRHGLVAQDCRIVAIDNAAAMVERCRELIAADDAATPVDVQQADLREVTIANASMVVMNYTLQFVPSAERAGVLAGIAAGLVDGGALVLSEKVRDDDPAIDALLVELHHDFKRRNAYSDLEIARKRAALENVLVPDTLAEHRQRLRAAGFRHIGVWLRQFNFVSLVAIR
ncbi:MAG: carboxy-S-adenosyl-L-methionine synthase CmoA [Woeseiaceae bacterium]|nr:carboxy-S-adenosyl-L-methionine synthase CmoA [Woeseiaceae bacterium]